MDVLLSSGKSILERKRVLQDDFGIAMTRELEDEVDYMCNISDGIVARAIERGLEQGIAQGIEQGMD
ncbi:MAG: hypothetical protein UHS41_04485 [Lachnospiraceae bacterium]|nr:hypothetical protein [Lachnospiraceae bacterium]